MESWLVPKVDTMVQFGPQLQNSHFHFRAWEGIRVERSHKYTQDLIHKICKAAGFTVVRLFEFKGYSDVLLKKDRETTE